ncbi:MAG: hypothetical protein WD766_02330 [Gemmatimonadota bacterium]
MSAAGVRYTAGTVLVAIAVVIGGVFLAGGDAMRGVLWGTAVAVMLQVAIFWTLFVWALPTQRGLAYGIGVLVRFMAVALMAFGGVSAMGLPLAPTLFSMVGCLFGSTLLEALFIQRQDSVETGAGAATIRTHL